jgi:hypothetical protein
MAATTQFGGKAQTLLQDVPKDSKDQYEARNGAHASIETGKIKLALEVVLLTDDEAKNLVEGKSGDWKSLYKKYPKAQGISLISLPGLNTDHTRALLYVGTSCGMLCGEGYFILLGKDGGEWKVLNKAMVWIS